MGGHAGVQRHRTTQLTLTLLFDDADAREQLAKRLKLRAVRKPSDDLQRLWPCRIRPPTGGPSSAKFDG